LPDNITCVQVVAGDGFTFALTDQGCIYGWGQFKDDLSSFYSFSAGVKVQKLPALVYQPEVRLLLLLLRALWGRGFAAGVAVVKRASSSMQLLRNSVLEVNDACLPGWLQLCTSRSPVPGVESL
jgi:hypothetical protein